MAFNQLKSDVQKELESFKSLPQKELSPVPVVGSPAPVSDKLSLAGRGPALVVFLRHCGCPFAEKTFRLLTKLSSRHPAIHCIAISHSSPAATEQWLLAIGGAWDVEVVVDEGRDLYAAWGLGGSSAWHALNPWTLYAAYSLGRADGIWNRGAGEGGSRWQMGGAFAVDAEGVVRWAQVAKAADEIPDFQAALAALGEGHGAARAAGQAA